MNILEQWVSTPLAYALGWALVHFVWQGALVALLLAGIFRVCRPTSARLRYAVACAALLAMPAAFFLTAALSFPAKRTQTVVAAYRYPPARRVLATGTASDSSAALAERLRRASPYLASFWLAGVLLFYAHSLTGWMAVQRMRRTGICVPPADWQQRLDRLAARLPVSRPVALVESCLTDVPVVVGYFRPMVLMPLGLLTGLEAGQLESILIHELAHVRRYDYLVNVLQTLVEDLLFFHPATWWVSGAVRAERENCCDDVVVAMTGDARDYAATLATLEASRWTVREPALAAAGGSLIRRIRRLRRQPEGPRGAVAPVLTGSLLLVSAAVALGAWQPRPSPAPQPAEPRPEQSGQMEAQPKKEVETPYRKWMKEDVAYIITDEERAVFERMRTDPEREQFIEQFWLRRDPTPGTVANEFKEEHYRRIAYANQRFAAKSVAGWKTDRGRIYIMYGPPDEIEDHPAGSSYQRPPEQGGATTTVFPFQQWRYRYIEGIGQDVVVEFVDPTRTGEFRMTSDPSEKDALGYVPGAAPTGASGRPANVLRAPGPRVSVDVGADRQATIRVPLDATAGEVHVHGVILDAGGRRVVAAFEDSVRGQSSYTKFVPLERGSYILKLTLNTVGARLLSPSQVFFTVD